MIIQADHADINGMACYGVGGGYVHRKDTKAKKPKMACLSSTLGFGRSTLKHVTIVLFDGHIGPRCSFCNHIERTSLVNVELSMSS
jgi:hypothetical protein